MAYRHDCPTLGARTLADGGGVMPARCSAHPTEKDAEDSKKARRVNRCMAEHGLRLYEESNIIRPIQTRWAREVR